MEVFNTARSPGRLRFADFEVDPRSGEVWKHGIRVRLQAQPFQVLCVLIERRGEIVTRDELKQALWPADTFVDFDNGLNTAVKKIRDLLGDPAERPRYVETIPRRGYRFIGTIEFPSPSQPAEPVAALNAQSVLPQKAAGAWWRPGRPAVFAVLGVLALAILLTGAVGSWRKRLGGHTLPHIESVAVLPLANLSRDPDQEYFADGMTEALIADLAQIKALRVISRTSAMHYKSTNKTLPQIARDLNVDAIIEGTVQRSGNRVQVTAKLIPAQTDTPVWAKIYDRDSQDVLVMQSELAQAIVSEIKVQLTPQERQHLASPQAINPDAYDCYLLGNYHASKRNPAALDKAVEYFQKAIRIDPGYAQAYAGLANTYMERDIWGGLGIGKSADKIRANTLKALELDGNLAEAHCLLGFMYFQYDWDWVRTEAEYKRAIELNANLPSSYERYAFFLQTMGRHQEAIAAVHHAVELDPLSPWYISEEGRILYRARRYKAAIERYERALELDPGYLPVLWRMAEAYEQLGKYDEAFVWAQKYQQATGDQRLDLVLRTRVYAHTGKRREAIEYLRRVEKNDERGNELLLAGIFVALGDHDQAIAELEKGAQIHSFLPFTFVDPQLDPLRSDPRFQELLRRVGLPS